MAKGMKTGGEDFVKGDDPRRNMTGLNRTPPEVKALRALTFQEFLDIVNRCKSMSFDELKTFVSEKKGTVLELFVANIMAQGMAKADEKKLAFFLDRFFGKPKERHDIEISGQLSGMPDDRRARLVAHVREFMLKEEEEPKQIEGETDNGQD